MRHCQTAQCLKNREFNFKTKRTVSPLHETKKPPSFNSAIPKLVFLRISFFNLFLVGFLMQIHLMRGSETSPHP